MRKLVEAPRFPWKPQREPATAALAGRAVPLIPSKTSKVPDDIFSAAMVACGLSLMAIVVLIVIELVLQSRLSIHAFGWSLFKGTNWDPVSGDFGAHLQATRIQENRLGRPTARRCG